MKKMLCLLLFAIPIRLLAQIEIKNTSLKHPDSALLYVGMPNNIKIFGLNNLQNLELKAQQGTALPLENGTFTVTAKTKDFDTLSLYQNNKLLLEKVFKIQHIPDVKPQLGYITTQEATVQQILSNTKLYSVIPNCDYKHYISIINFVLTIHNQQNVLLVDFGDTFGNELTRQQIAEIKKIKPGSKLVFDNIKATCPDCSLRRLNAITITIKQ